MSFLFSKIPHKFCGGTNLLFIRLLVPFALLIFSAVAEETSAEVRFLAEQALPESGKVCVIAEEEFQSEPFQLSTRNLSEPLKLPARTFQLKAEAKNDIVAQVSLPEKGKKFIVILIPDSEGAYRGMIIPSDLTEFKKGDVYFYNHSDETILGNVGSSSFSLGPEQDVLLRPEGVEPGENFYNVSFSIERQDKNRPISSTRWPGGEPNRSYIFFRKDPVSGRITYRAVEEFISLRSEK